MIYYEEPQIEGKMLMARGKVNWFTYDQLLKYAPEQIKKINSSEDINYVELKEHLIEVLKKKGFVFFDNTYYRYKLNKGKLSDFGINFHHIK